MDSAVEMIDIGEGLMGEEVPFQITPGSFDVVEFGAYFGCHSTVSQSRAASTHGSRGFAGMDRAVVENKDDGLVRAARARPVDRVEAGPRKAMVAAALGGAVLDDR